MPEIGLLVFTSPETETLLGLKRGTLEGSAARWLEVLHPLDRDRFRAALDSVLEQRRGRLTQEFRLRAPDGHYLWFALKARPVVGSDGEVVRIVGTLTDVTEFKNAEERLLHDAVHDNLTGLPNRELFIDRLCASGRMPAAQDHGLGLFGLHALSALAAIRPAVATCVGVTAGRVTACSPQ